MHKILRCAIFIWLAFLVPGEKLFAQNTDKQNPKFDSAFRYIATALASQNVEEAILQADTLLHSAVDSLQKMKSLMLLATLKERTGEYTEALLLAVQGEKIAENIKNKEWEIRISGFLSTSFRQLGLLVQGRKYLAKAEKANEGPQGLPLIQMFIHQEKAYYEIEAQKYENALAEVKIAFDILQAAGEGNEYAIFMATCLQLEGYCHLQLGHLKEAETYLLKSLKILAHQETELKGFIYQNLGELALKQGKYQEAGKALDSALSFANKSNNFNMKIMTYKSLNAYYLKVGDQEKVMLYQSKFIELSQMQTTITAKVSNSLIEKFDSELQENHTRNLGLTVTCILLLLVMILSYVYSRRSRKKEREKYLDYIHKLRLDREKLPALESSQSEAHIGDINQIGDIAPHQVSTDVLLVYETTADGAGVEIDAAPAEVLIENHKLGVSISKETEERLLKDLYRFEQKYIYLKSDITLPYLAARLKTNTKYLSSIINEHKGKDFNNYINELRINYIIAKLQTEPIYRDYKIAYLAQESGFSGHSKFATNFKQITGISPSAFISNMKLDAKQ
ncbi:helix-turn-helix domain-containing protein [Taibaiella sp. KBW10]|uniref:helix-turn-helix domain-containing protein n=1 Tax=Taibaiella sp. KBW10 TaxID=2153357 RepID=UPI0013157036|nr:helix-turn-helix domain-containing protein [Taibaiella sp. KBW10]